MGHETYANFDSWEGTVSSPTTVTLNWKARRITITNDSATKSLGFKFNETEDYGTLKPTETLSMQIVARTIFLNGSGVACRVWGIG